MSESLGARELILALAIVLLWAVAPFLLSGRPGRQWTKTAAARAYLDRLFGPARRPLAELIRPKTAIRGEELLSKEDM